MTPSRESLWAVAPADRPRERLARLGPAGLTDAELVALVLGSGLPGVNVLDNAASLLAQAGGVQELMVMTVRELTALAGVGVATAGRVVAVSELWRRAHDPLPGTRIEHPRDIVDVVRAFLSTRADPHPSAATAAYPPRSAATRTDPHPSAATAAHPQPSAATRADPHPSAATATGSCPSTLVIVADEELRVRVVVALAPVANTPAVPGEAGAGDRWSIRSLVPRVLHEVLYRGGSAFALVELRPPAPATVGAPGSADATSDGGVRPPAYDLDELRAARDVLRLAAATVGLRFLSTVVISGDDWSVVD
ncbi:UPF0758 domain-containing protein [Subtercola sp. YIM 133946]|uniref:UPF0758 domain-containing protein n=1 Tax=Subtercola sp. YIM 133946 TaxID=3118909 RepID=UPI002F9327B5